MTLGNIYENSRKPWKTPIKSSELSNFFPIFVVLFQSELAKADESGMAPNHGSNCRRVVFTDGTAPGYTCCRSCLENPNESA